MLKYYNEIKLEDDIVMSCDMLRLSFNMNNIVLKNFNMFIEQYQINHLNIKVKYFVSHQTFQFKNLLQIENLQDGSSFAMGLGFNSMQSKQTETCFIEFNPNKCINNNLVTPFLEFIKLNCHFIDVVRYDIAFDIPMPRMLFNLIKDRRNYKKMYSLIQESKDMSNCTEYLGSRSNNGYVKLYNKQLECNLNEPLTRLELTLDKLDYSNLQKEMPTMSVFTFNCCDFNNLNDTEKVLLSLLLNSDNCIQYFNSLGRVMKDKLQKYICTCKKINISESDFYHFVMLINKIIN